MKKHENHNAMLAARWIDQRLHEMVTHWQPTMQAISDAHRETASVTAGDPRGFTQTRQMLAGDIARMRGDMIRDADKLLDLRQKIAPQSGVFPQVPPIVVAELRRLRGLHAEYLEERYAEEQWFDRALDYHFECTRCEHDGDVRPSPSDYGLDQGGHSTDDERDDDTGGYE